MNLKLYLQRKPSDFQLSDCLIDKVITLPQKEFDDLIRRPLASRDWIAQDRDVMYQDEKGKHCLLVLGAGCFDGVVMEAEGADYARYATFLPGASTLVKREVELAADFIVKNGVQHSSTGEYMTTFEEVGDECGLKVRPGNGFAELIRDELNWRDEVAEVALREAGFDTSYFPDYCFYLDDHPESAQEQGQQM